MENRIKNESLRSAAWDEFEQELHDRVERPRGLDEVKPWAVPVIEDYLRHEGECGGIDEADDNDA